MSAIKPKTNITTTLYAKLLNDDANRVRSIIQASSGIFSANEMLQQLKGQGIQTSVFSSLYGFIGDLEGVRAKTYRDTVTDHMAIGIGLDLVVHKDSELEAIFTASFNSGRRWDLQTIRSTVNWPKEGLDSNEVKKLFLYTLTGVTNAKGTFVGLMPQFIDRLHGLASDFRNAPFSAYQLVALQSAAFNAPALIGNGMLTGLKVLVTSHNDVGVLVDLMEDCNKNLDPGLQNRRLKEIALFHGKASSDTLDVHLSLRQYQRIIKGHQVQLVGGPVIWGTPCGEEQKVFKGGDQIDIIPGMDPQGLDNEVYGSVQSDTLVASDGNPALYGGDGDDILIVPDATSEERWTYLAGDDGNNIYVFGDNPGQVFIYDINRAGKLVRGGEPIQGLVLNGNLTCGNYSYQLNRDVNSAGTYWVTINWGNNILTIPGYVNGQFNVLWATEHSLKFEFDFDRFLVNDAAVLNDGNIVIYGGNWAQQPETSVPMVKIFTHEGMLIKESSIDPMYLDFLKWGCSCGPVLPQKNGDSVLLITGSSETSELCNYTQKACAVSINSAGQLNVELVCDGRYAIPWVDIGPNYTPIYGCPSSAEDSCLCTNCYPPAFYTISLNDIYMLEIDQKFGSTPMSWGPIYYEEIQISVFKKKELVFTTKILPSSEALGGSAGYVQSSWFPTSTGYLLLWIEEPYGDEHYHINNIYFEPIIYQSLPNYAKGSIEVIADNKNEEKAGNSKITPCAEKDLQMPGDSTPKLETISNLLMSPPEVTSATSRLEPSIYLILPLQILVNVQRSLLVKWQATYPYEQISSIAAEIHIPSNVLALPFAAPRSSSATIAMEDTSQWQCKELPNDQLICLSPDRNLLRAVTKLKPFSGLTWMEIRGDGNYKCSLLTNDTFPIRYCIGEKTEFLEYRQGASILQDEALSTLKNSALSGAAFAIIPEAIGDALYLGNIVSFQNAQYAKSAINFGMLLLFGSWLSFGAAYLISVILIGIGCCESTARVTGNTVAFTVNAIRNFSHLGVASVAVNYAAGRIGFWAEKRLAQKISAVSTNVQAHEVLYSRA